MHRRITSSGMPYRTFILALALSTVFVRRRDWLANPIAVS
jgi:hypothetical protein